MSYWPILGNSRGADGYPTSSGSQTQPYSHSTNANTKGSWYEAIASTPYDGYIFILVYYIQAAIAYLMDIGIGAEGSEQVIVNNLTVDGDSTLLIPEKYVIPIKINAGTRVVVRTQSTTANRYVLMQASIIGSGGFTDVQKFRICDTYGDATADSGGTSIDPGGSANTKGSWTQITSSTTRHHRGLFLGIGNAGNTARPWAMWNVDIGVGANPNEVSIISNYRLFSDVASDFPMPRFSPLFPVSIPAGTRLCVRASCSIIDTVDRLFDAIIYGLS